MHYSNIVSKSKLKIIDDVFKKLVLTFISLSVISLCIYVLNMFNTSNPYNIIEGVANKDEASTPWTKLPVNKQIEKLLNESNTMTEHTLNSSQGDPAKVDYDKLIYIQKLKTSLRDIESSGSSGESYKQQMTKYNPFAGKGGNDNDDDGDKKGNGGDGDGNKYSKFFW
jgi:hypothetical protein